MKTAPPLALAAVVLLSLVCAPLAYLINVSISDVDFAAPSKLAYTQVRVLSGNTVLFQNATDKYGNDVFELAAGTYFISLNRSYYPEHIVLYTAISNATLDAKMNIHKSTYDIYGQVIDNPSSRWENKTISLLDENGQVIGSRIRIAKDGYYIVPYLYPAKTYQIRLDGEGAERLVSPQFSFERPNAYWLALDLSARTLANATPAISVPPKSELSGTIVAFIRAADQPMTGQSVTIKTPAGTLSATSDENGAVRVYAAGAGTYEFVWNNQSVKSVVEAPAPVPVPEPVITPKPPEPAPQPENETVAPPAAEPKAVSVEQIMVLLIVGLIGVGVVVAAFMLAMAVWKKIGEKKGAEQKPAMEKSGGASPASISSSAVSSVEPMQYHKASQAARHKAKHKKHGKK